MQLKPLLLACLFIVALPDVANWTADTAKAKISFSVKGPFGTVNGSFSGLKASINFDDKNPAAGSITASIDAKTISTGIGMRNGHLRNKEEWLNTDKYPTISFHSKKIEKNDKGYVASGELELKGTTKPVNIPFTFTGNGSTGMFKGRFMINREDYKVGKPGGSVGNEIAIEIELPVKK